ncbi:MAG: hypothetical protein FVQ78_09785 [Solirubrobacterales bacterium]|nr:hypothetical protein [Solirubrobacterales bacterium]
MPRFSLQFPADSILGLAARFSYPKEDSACLAAGVEAAARGHYTLDKLILICEWKTGRTKTLVAANTEEDAEFVTGEALRATDERSRMATMKWLQGVDVPTASALLFFAFPDDYPIIDERALEALGQEAPRYYSLKFWTEYLDACRAIAEEVGVPIRTLDKAIWQFSKETPR